MRRKSQAQLERYYAEDMQSAFTEDFFCFVINHIQMSCASSQTCQEWVNEMNTQCRQDFALYIINALCYEESPRDIYFSILRTITQSFKHKTI